MYVTSLVIAHTDSNEAPEFSVSRETVINLYFKIIPPNKR